MKITAALHRRLHWLNLPGTLLIALLQRTPAVSVVASATNTALVSPVSTVLKAAAATLGALGAVHSLAGATTLSYSPNVSPGVATVGAGKTFLFTVTGAETPPASFTVGGSVPPGMSFSPVNSATPGITVGVVNASTLQLTGTPTAAGQYVIKLQAWEGPNATLISSSIFSYTINVAAAINSAPTITAQPTGTSVSAGGTVVLSAAAAGSPTPTFQWFKNSVALSGQTASTLVISGASPADAGNYTLVATNSLGSAASNIAAVTVTGSTGTAPAFTTQPVGKTIATGSTVVFTTSATGSPAPTYQWRQNGVAISGATLANLVLVGTTAGQAGVYTCVATNSAGAVTSSGATLTVQVTADAGRIDNLSVLTTLAAGEPYFTVGTVIGGAGTSGTKPLLVRAAGPTLGAAPFSIGGTLPDPKLDFFSGQTVVATNDNWGTPVGSGAASATALSAAFTTRQAFPFISTTSKDAAVFNPAIASGSYTVQVSDAGGGTGLVIAELYDNTATAFTATTPRLVNVSVLKMVPTGGLITLGFNIGGSTARTVLIRAMGPTLAPAPFNVPNVMADPKLDLFPAGASTPSASNDNWGGDAQVLTVNNTVTFAPLSATSKDAILLITLAPGGYTVQVSPATGTAGGNVIAEVYEIP